MSKKQLVLVAVIVVLLLGAGASWYFARGTAQFDLASASGGSSTGSGLPPDKIAAGEHVLGSANAPVTMIEYFSQICSVCSHFDQTVFPLLKAKYIDTGKVRYVMRLLPIRPLDGPSYKLDLCVPPENFFTSVDLLFRNQTQWDADEYPTVTDPHGGLIKMARIMGLSAEQADACMNSTKLDAAINKVAEDANTRYQPDGTPTFVIEFKRVDMPTKSWEEVQTALDAALKAKGVK